MGDFALFISVLFLVYVVLTIHSWNLKKLTTEQIVMSLLFSIWIGLFYWVNFYYYLDGKGHKAVLEFKVAMAISLLFGGFTVLLFYLLIRRIK